MSLDMRLIIIWGIMILGAAGSLIPAEQETGKKTTVLPQKVFETILDLIEKKEFTRIKIVQPFLTELCDTISGTYKVDLYAEFAEVIKTEDKRKIRHALFNIIFYDLIMTFENIKKGKEDAKIDAEKLKARLKIAYLDYLFLSPVISEVVEETGKDGEKVKRKIGLEADRKIKKTFQNAHQSLGGKSPYQTKQEPPDLKLFTEYSNKIKDGILVFFPDFIRPAKKATEDKTPDNDENKK